MGTPRGRTWGRSQTPGLIPGPILNPAADPKADPKAAGLIPKPILKPGADPKSRRRSQSCGAAQGMRSALYSGREGRIACPGPYRAPGGPRPVPAGAPPTPKTARGKRERGSSPNPIDPARLRPQKPPGKKEGYGERRGGHGSSPNPVNPTRLRPQKAPGKKGGYGERGILPKSYKSYKSQGGFGPTSPELRG